MQSDYTDRKTEAYPALTPIIAPWMERILRDKEKLISMFEQHGSPINIHHTKPFAENYNLFAGVMNGHQLSHTIFFARKANKCRAFAREAKRQGFGVDTASYTELKECLELGPDPQKLVLTAAIKTEKLVRLALQNRVLMILDNADECQMVNQIAKELGKKPGIGIRISGFEFKSRKLYSRFGFDIDDAPDFIINHLSEGNRYENLTFSGFHFHLDGYSIEQRSAALSQTVKVADILQNHGIETRFIDMGGGFLVNYLKDKTEWETFWNELKRAVRGEREPVTFGNNGLGYKLVGGKLQGEPDVYPYFNETPKEKFLDAVLSRSLHGGDTPAKMLRERNIELRMEPGRSLLDQTGLTMARVIHRKKDQNGDWLIGLEMNRSQLSSSSTDFLLDPIFISMNPAQQSEKPVFVYFTGGYCLEQDVILKRKIALPHLPEIGDIVCFPNTAGYMMHFYETQSHLYDFSANLVLDENLNFQED
jgi:diaminopimelate decarboxylase